MTILQAGARGSFDARMPFEGPGCNVWRGGAAHSVFVNCLQADTLCLHINRVGIVSMSQKIVSLPSFLPLDLFCLPIFNKEELWETYSFLLKSPDRRSTGQTWWQMATDTWPQRGESLRGGGVEAATKRSELWGTACAQPQPNTAGSGIQSFRLLRRNWTSKFLCKLSQ